MPAQEIVNKFLFDRYANNCAAGTITWYKRNLLWFVRFADDRCIGEIEYITPQDIREYLVFAEQTGHNPGGVHGMFRSLKTFLRWYEFEHDGFHNPISRIRSPKLEKRILDPTDLAVVKKILETCNYKFAGQRDRAIILVLMDTGLRASELLNINISDINFSHGSIRVRLGKGRKDRSVYVGRCAIVEIIRYLAIKRNHREKDPLFVNDEGRRLGYEGLRQMLRRRSLLVGEPAPTLHSFRRFFALTFLRNGGDIFTLQRLMGHSDLQVMQRYLKQIDDDLERGHRQFGPVDRLWR